MAKILILGAGFSGVTTAYLLSKKGHKVTVLEGSDHPGDGVWTKFYGGHPYTFGPRIFYTWDKEVFEHIEKFVKLRKFYTRTWTYVEKDKKLYHYPIQKKDIKMMPDSEKIIRELAVRKGKKPSVEDFETYWIDMIGQTLYEKFVNNYSKKMWGVKSNKELVADFKWVNKGTPIRNGDDRLYTDQFQGYPEAPDGYNEYFIKSLKGSEVLFNCKIDHINTNTRTVTTSKGDFTGDVIINTIHVDTLLKYTFGELRYYGRKLLKVVVPVEYSFPEDVTWIHYSGNEPFTRITEFKKITDHKASDTLLGIEIPSVKNRLYPVQSKSEFKKYEQYKSLFPKNFYSIGRLGTFKYKGIEDVIRESLDLSKTL
ncbi:FAD-dependent oxidoreductase [Candidatus Peregrinibacteria bacterium]|nr:FAD-dependent oxidoreductase [Candidatus Peregrinibacteria bacterium]